MVVVDQNIRNFKEFCGVTDDELASLYLHRSDGNLEAAIQLYYQTETDEETVEDHKVGNTEPEVELRHRKNNGAGDLQTALNTQDNTLITTSHSSLVQPWRQFLVAVAALPFNFVISTIYDVLEFFYELIFGERPLTIIEVRRDISHFRRAVKEKFEKAAVRFMNGTLDEAYHFLECSTFNCELGYPCLCSFETQALAASKDSCRILVVYLFTPGDRYSEETVRRLLEDEAFSSIVDHFKMVLWGADPHSKTGRNAARKLKITTFPCILAISSRDDASMVMCVERPTSPEEVTDPLYNCGLDELGYYYSKEFRRRLADENRELMKQQEMEYRESEERDRAVMAERRRQQQLEEEEAKTMSKLEQAREHRRQERLKVIRKIRDDLLANKVADDYDGKDAIRVLVRYPSGDTSQHRFSPDDNTQDLFCAIFPNSSCPDFFEAHYGFPRTKLDFYPIEYHEILMADRLSTCQEATFYVSPKTFKELGICSSLTLYVSNIDS